MDLSKLSDADLEALNSGDLSRVSDAGLSVLSGESPAPAKKERTWHDDLKDAYSGQLKSAMNISQTLMTPVNRLIDKVQGNEGGSFDKRNAKAFDDGALAGADQKSAAFQTGKTLGDIELTMPAGNVVGAGLKGLGLTKLGNAVQTGGMSIGPGGNAFTRAGSRVAGGAINGGVTAGLANPDEAGTGAAVGAAFPTVVGAAGKAGNMVRNAFTPTDSALARKAVEEYGIPLSASDITDNSLVKGARSVLDDIPFIGRIGDAQKQAKQAGFNRAVGRTFGADADKLTPEVMSASRKDIGNRLNQVWQNNTLKVDDDFLNQLGSIEAEATKKLNPEQASAVKRQIDNLIEKAENGQINGEFANNWQAELRQIVDGETGLQKSILNKLRQSTLGAFNKGLTPEYAALLKEAKGQYKAYKTVSPLISKSEAGVAARDAGDVPPSLLPGAVFGSYGDYVSDSPFADLSKIGSKYIADRVPRTGGSPRAAVQNGFLGTILGLGGYTSPIGAAASIPLAASAEKLLSSPELAKKLLQDNPGLLREMLRTPASIGARSLPVLATE